MNDNPKPQGNQWARTSWQGEPSEPPMPTRSSFPIVKLSVAALILVFILIWGIIFNGHELLGISMHLPFIKYYLSRGPGRTVDGPEVHGLLAEGRRTLEHLEGMSPGEAEQAKIVVLVAGDRRYEGFSFLFEDQDPNRHLNFAQISLMGSRGLDGDEIRVEAEVTQNNRIVDLGNVPLRNLAPPPPDNGRGIQRASPRYTSIAAQPGSWIQSSPPGFTSIAVQPEHSYWLHCTCDGRGLFPAHDFYVKLRILTQDKGKSLTFAWDYGPGGRKGLP